MKVVIDGVTYVPEMVINNQEVTDNVLQSSVEYNPDVGEFCEAWFDSVQEWCKVEVLKHHPDGGAACYIIEHSINGANLKWASKFRPIDLVKEALVKEAIQIVGDSETMLDGFNKLYELGYLTKKVENHCE